MSVGWTIALYSSDHSIEIGKISVGQILREINCGDFDLLRLLIVIIEQINLKKFTQLDKMSLK